MTLIEATGLRKRYGSVAALDGLDLAVEEGHVVGLLGPNGAGKTTALRILVGLVRADAGRVTIAGESVDLGWVAGERVGAMVATPVFYPHLSGTENLRVLAAAWGWPRARADARIEAALRLVDLAAVGPRASKGYSTGMRQRLGIALALLADAPILILDEPVNGLDPAGIVEIRDLLLHLASGGRTILVSSHLLTEVEKTCDHVTIVDRGRIVASGTPQALAGGGERIEVRLGGADEVAAAHRAIEAAGFAVAADPDPEAFELWIDGAPDGATIGRLLAAAGIYPDQLIRRRDSLEDVFLRLTGVSARASRRREEPGRRRLGPVPPSTRPVRPGAPRAAHPRCHVRRRLQQRRGPSPGRFLHRSAGPGPRRRVPRPDDRRVAEPPDDRAPRTSRSRPACSR